MALASLALSLSKTGSPSPFGGFLMTISMMAPRESASFMRACSINLIILGAMLLSAQRTSFFSINDLSKDLALTLPTWMVWPKISVLFVSFKSFLAMAPAITRQMVSRPEERPPPR